ncbi:MAG: pyridoxamine 5'-phosphate oxidase family protein [Chloroflexota bacterium]
MERDDALRLGAAADHAVLATLNRTGAADLVPVCFALVGEDLAIPIDSVKPKGSGALGRVRNLERDPRATLLVEHWDPDDWSRLWWVRIELRSVAPAALTLDGLVQALRDRYPQYRDAPFTQVLAFRVEQVSGWSAGVPGLDRT